MPPFNPLIHHRRSIRLSKYNYATPNAYFVTICTFQKQCLFGEIVEGEMKLNEVGKMVEYWWKEIPQHFQHATDIDETFIIMPNHIHGIIWINDGVRAGFPRPGPGSPGPGSQGSDAHGPFDQGAETAPLQKIPSTLGQIVAYFKYRTTKNINSSLQRPPLRIWHRNYYEHVIRSEVDLQRIRAYIRENPLKWNLNPENT